MKYNFKVALSEEGETGLKSDNGRVVEFPVDVVIVPLEGVSLRHHPQFH